LTFTKIYLKNHHVVKTLDLFSMTSWKNQDEMPEAIVSHQEELSKIDRSPGHQWLTPVILATWLDKIRRIVTRIQQGVKGGRKVSKTLSQPRLSTVAHACHIKPHGRLRSGGSKFQVNLCEKSSRDPPPPPHPPTQKKKNLGMVVGA
jgi:hypothetical protein